MHTLKDPIEQIFQYRIQVLAYHISNYSFSRYFFPDKTCKRPTLASFIRSLIVRMKILKQHFKTTIDRFCRYSQAKPTLESQISSAFGPGTLLLLLGQKIDNKTIIEFNIDNRMVESDPAAPAHTHRCPSRCCSARFRWRSLPRHLWTRASSSSSWPSWSWWWCIALAHQRRPSSACVFRSEVNVCCPVRERYGNGRYRDREFFQESFGRGRIYGHSLSFGWCWCSYIGSVCVWSLPPPLVSVRFFAVWKIQCWVVGFARFHPTILWVLYTIFTNMVYKTDPDGENVSKYGLENAERENYVGTETIWSFEEKQPLVVFVSELTETGHGRISFDLIWKKIWSQIDSSRFCA